MRLLAQAYVSPIFYMFNWENNVSDEHQLAWTLVINYIIYIIPQRLLLLVLTYMGQRCIRRFPVDFMYTKGYLILDVFFI